MGGNCRRDESYVDVRVASQEGEAGKQLLELHDLSRGVLQGLFKVVVAAWCRVDTPWVRYKPGGHG